MSGSSHAVNDPFGKRQGAPRRRVLAGSVTTDEKQAVLRAMAQGGFKDMSEGVRAVCFAYRDSAEVRDAVHSHIRQKSA